MSNAQPAWVRVLNGAGTAILSCSTLVLSLRAGAGIWYAGGRCDFPSTACKLLVRVPPKTSRTGLVIVLADTEFGTAWSFAAVRKRRWRGLECATPV
jgi:hypothetical protein